MAKSKKVITKTIDEQIQEKASYIVTIHDIKKDDEFKKTAAQINKILAIDAKKLQQKYSTGFYKDVKGDYLLFKNSYYKNPNQRIYFSSENKSQSMIPFYPQRTDATNLTQFACLVGPQNKGHADSANYLLSNKNLPMQGPSINTQGHDNWNEGKALSHEFFGGSYLAHAYYEQFINCYARHEFSVELMTNYDAIAMPNGLNVVNGHKYESDFRDSGLHAAILSHFTIPARIQMRIIPHSYEPQRFDNIDTSPGAPAPPLECCTWDPGSDSLPHFDFTYITKQGSQCRNLRWIEEATKWWAMFFVETIPFFSSSDLVRPLHVSKYIQLLTLNIDGLNDTEPALKLKKQRTQLKKFFEEFNKDKKIYSSLGGENVPITAAMHGSSYTNSLPAVGKYAVDFDFNVYDIPSFFLPPLFEFLTKDNFSNGNHPKVVEWTKNNPYKKVYTDEELYSYQLQDKPIIVDQFFDKTKNNNTIVKTGMYPYFTYGSKHHIGWYASDIYHQKLFDTISGLAYRDVPSKYTTANISAAMKEYINCHRFDGLWMREKGFCRYYKANQDPTSSMQIDPWSEY